MSSTQGSSDGRAAGRDERREPALPSADVGADATLSDAARDLRELTRAEATEPCLFVFGGQVRVDPAWQAAQLAVAGQEPLLGHLVCGETAADVRAQREGRPSAEEAPALELQVLAEWNGSTIVLRHPNATESISIDDFVRNGLQMPSAAGSAYFAPRADMPSRMDTALPALRRLAELSGVVWMLE